MNYQCAQGAGSDDIDEPTRIENMAREYGGQKSRPRRAGNGAQCSITASVAEGADGPESRSLGEWAKMILDKLRNAQKAN